MPTIISLGVVNALAVQQNSGVFIGDINVNGWDAHIKYNAGYGSLYGSFNVVMGSRSVNFDGLEVLDGVIQDQDWKTCWAVQG
ncbi:hypothetical protein GCM10025857_11980 [Alicyclobacillus contaminans]|uniref:hypothetical protein n=1 Tax=Alicyclobacillus contaminans TaxID=392016 RepID=UPI0004193FF5|nr:hypothetical protein [Alicyclobacillus contaminans]GMA49841.1 hypothetical protein GCM10025857_11980 [Alicyclobacillus contaminans]